MARTRTAATLTEDQARVIQGHLEACHNVAEEFTEKIQELIHQLSTQSYDSPEQRRRSAADIMERIRILQAARDDIFQTIAAMEDELESGIEK